LLTSSQNHPLPRGGQQHRIFPEGAIVALADPIFRSGRPGASPAPLPMWRDVLAERPKNSHDSALDRLRLLPFAAGFYLRTCFGRSTP
jgi:hypothetical protein